MATPLLLAAALAFGQSEAAPAAPAPQSAAQPAPAPAPSVVVPTAPQPAPSSQPATPPAVSTAPQDQLELQSTVRPYEMPAAVAPAAPVPYAGSDAADAKAPVRVEEYHRNYEGPTDEVEASYDAGVKSAFQAEQALHGALDGVWILSAADGSPILSLVIADPGEGRGPLGGAWRDLSRPRDPTASGVIDEMIRDGRAVVVRIRLRETGPLAVLKLSPAPDGRWRGELKDAGASRPVLLDRKAI